MPSGQIAGKHTLAAGLSPNNIRIILASGRADVFDNAAGSEPYYASPGGMTTGMPRNDGIPLTLPLGPHVLPGENLYVLVESNVQDGVDSDDVSAVLNIEGTLYDRRTGGTRPFLVSAVGDRNSTIAQGGVRDDPFVNIGERAVVYAFGPLSRDEDLTLHGRLQLDIRDDTA